MKDQGSLVDGCPACGGFGCAYEKKLEAKVDRRSGITNPVSQLGTMVLELWLEWGSLMQHQRIHFITDQQQGWMNTWLVLWLNLFIQRFLWKRLGDLVIKGPLLVDGPTWLFPALKRNVSFLLAPNDFVSNPPWLSHAKGWRLWLPSQDAPLGFTTRSSVYADKLWSFMDFLSSLGSI